MITSLRKGFSSVYLQYKNTGESMGADEFEIEVNDDILILRFNLKPVDSNQRDDEGHLHEMELLSVTIDDDYITPQFIDYVERKTITCFHVEIISRKKCLVFKIAEDPSALNDLTFSVKNIIS